MSKRRIIYLFRFLKGVWSRGGGGVNQLIRLVIDTLDTIINLLTIDDLLHPQNIHLVCGFNLILLMDANAIAPCLGIVP